ncbi:hypothetical protein [Caldibacillus debilis]|uniref:hypothetical protein n=1 Tax=Caldibacillus debilis TaxID=301148 RepID=UPI000779ACBC|nr:hypothetical protein [Caldibacillus debilis]
MIQEVFNLEKNQFEQLDSAEAEALKAAGLAVDIDPIAHIREVDYTADEIVRAYKEAVEDIRNTDDPRIRNVPGAEEYEIKRLKQLLDDGIRELEEIKKQRIDEFYEKAMREKANAIKSISATEKESARFLIEKLTNEVKYGSLENAVSELESQIKFMRDERKKAVMLEFSKFADAVEGKIKNMSDARRNSIQRRMRVIYQELNDVKDPAIIKARMAEALKEQTTSFTSYTILKLAHSTYAGGRSNHAVI